MEINKILVLNIWGNYAHFRRGYTTTSPTTFSFPSRTSLSGLVSAILGLPNEKTDPENSYYQFFRKENSAFALKILNPIKKRRININLIDTKDHVNPLYFKLGIFKGRTLIPFEFIKDPKYRVYVWLKEEKLYKDLKEMLENHKSTYTPCLGISECIANFEFKGEFVGETAPDKKPVNESIEIDSIIKQDKNIKIKVESKKYGTARMPLFMNKNREVEEYATFVYETEGNPITIEKGVFYKVGSENVIFF